MITNGRIKQTLAYWCLNATDWQWNIERICETAVRLALGASRGRQGPSVSGRGGDPEGRASELVVGRDERVDVAPQRSGHRQALERVARAHRFLPMLQRAHVHRHQRHLNALLGEEYPHPARVGRAAHVVQFHSVRLRRYRNTRAGTYQAVEIARLFDTRRSGFTVS